MNAKRDAAWNNKGRQCVGALGFLDGKLLLEDNRQTLTRTEYIYAGGRLVAKKIQPITSTGTNNGTATITTIHTDFLGSPVAETNSAGTVTRVERYTPYGEPSDLQLDVGPGFTGHATDVLTGLTYMQQRYMDQEIGRFLTPDPVGPEEDFVNHFNRYNYAQNNPVRYTDPDGRDIMVISGGLREGGVNWAGHVAGAIEGNGMFSYGNGTPQNSSVSDYINSQSMLRPQQITIIPTTLKQDNAARSVAAKLSEKVTKLDNCAVRTNTILNAADIESSSIPLPKVTETVAASQPGATTYQIPKGGEIPKALLKILPSFEKPTVKYSDRPEARTGSHLRPKQ